MLCLTPNLVSLNCVRIYMRCISQLVGALWWPRQPEDNQLPCLVFGGLALCRGRKRTRALLLVRNFAVSDPAIDVECGGGVCLATTSHAWREVAKRSCGQGLSVFVCGRLLRLGGWSESLRWGQLVAVEGAVVGGDRGGV